MKAVAYLRKSTKDKQVNSLEIQRTEIESYAKKNGIEIVVMFEEAISGTIKDRPELHRAMRMAKKLKCPIIAKSLSRIGRNASQVLDIIDNQELIITDYGKTLDKDFLMMMSVVNQIEVKTLKKRVKASLAYLRDVKGVQLGNRTNLPEAQEKGRAAQKTKADKFALKLAPLLSEECSHSKMARKLNDLGIRTARGGIWHHSSIGNMRKRLESLKR